MQIIAKTLDDLLRRAFLKILKDGTSVKASRGRNKEISGALLVLTNPLARLSHTEKRGKIFSALGELAWYLSGNDSGAFIAYYIDKYTNETEENGRVNGAYGPRLFLPKGRSQFDRILTLLKAKSSSRKAVIQLFDRKDLEHPYKDVPCTCTMQFMVRAGQLDLIVSMRSNDAYLGLPHDIFTFTMIQEYTARLLKLDLGVYKHFTASLHIYENNIESARTYIDEGWQDTTAAAMPRMPSKSVRANIKKWLAIEKKLRKSQPIHDETFSEVDPYWSDLSRLLLVLSHIKHSSQNRIPKVLRQMHSKVYREYIVQKAQPAKTSPRFGRPQLFETDANDDQVSKID